MAKIKIKYSTNGAGGIPTFDGASGLTTGELAVNLVQNRMFIGSTANTLELVGLGAGNTFTGRAAFLQPVYFDESATFNESILVSGQAQFDTSAFFYANIGVDSIDALTSPYVQFGNAYVNTPLGISTSGITLNGTRITTLVSSVNGKTGTVGLSAGLGITFPMSPAGNTFHINLNYLFGGSTMPSKKIGPEDWIAFQQSGTPNSMYLANLPALKVALYTEINTEGPPTGFGAGDATSALPQFNLNGFQGACGSDPGLTSGFISFTNLKTAIVSDGIVTSFNGRTGAVTGASLGANTFTGLQTSATGFSGPLTGNATTATTATNSTQLGGVAAASYALLASPTFTGTPASTTAAVGTNTTQIATTAFVQNEIVADTVTSFNGRTGSVQGVSAAVAGDGISVSGATGAVTITNAGVTRAVAGTGISVSANTGTVTITNSGVTSLAAGTGVAVSAGTGAVTVTNIGVQSFNGATGAVTGASLGANTFTGLQTSATGFSGPLTGNATTATNSTQLGGVAAASYALLASPTFTGTPASTTAAVGTNTTQIATTAFVQNEIVADTVTAFNGRTGSVQGVSAAVAGSGISVSAATGSVTISNTGVLSFNGNAGAVTGASLGANTFTGLQTSATGFSGPITGAVTGNATTATTLQTARNINGTAFNGSADITTANWGTSRTITIGSTGKSVNGSADVSWTLGEIGAVGTGTANTFTALQTFTGGISAAAGITLVSPSLTGTPTAPTATSGTNTTQVATTQFVRTEITNLVNAAPAALDTLNELAAALGNDANFSTTITNSLANKAGTTGGGASGTWGISITGNAATATNSTQLGGTAAASWALLASPTFTGTPASTTAAVGTNTTQIATTAFVQNEIVADTVTAFNGRTGSVQGVSAAVAGDGITVSGATGSVTITNAGVTRAVAGTGISVNANTGTVTITNSGVTSLAAGTGVGVNASTGAVTVTNNGVQSFNGSTGAITGVGSIVAGSNVTISPTGGTGAVTINATVPTVNNGTLTMNTSGNGISGTQTFTANQSSAATFTVASNATDANTASTIVFRNASGNFSAGTITAALTGTASNASALGNTAASGWAQLAAANTFTGLQTSATGFSGPLTGNATTATTATNSTQLGGVAAANYALLASPTFTGTPASTTAAVGTNTTQIATTAFVQNEIIADTVTSFNGRTGAVQGVSAAVAGDGITVSGATGSVTITNAGVTRAVAGTGISVNANTGTVTITNSGVTSLAAGTGIGVNASTGAVTVTNNGVQSFNGSTGAISGVGSIVAGSNVTISPTGGTGAVTINATVPTVNNGTLTMNTSGNGISGTQTFTANQSSAATFTVTSNATNANTASTIVFRDASGNFSAGTITASLTGTASNSSALGNTAASGWAQLGSANTFTGLQTSATGFSGPLTGNATSATNASQLGGVAAASYALLASPTFTGTPASTTAAVGTNTTQIATTAFVQNEIVADTVTAFNGRTGSVQGVSAAVAGDGITVSGATGSVTITNAGVTRAVAGTGISVNANTGTVTITNSGVLSFNGATGAVTGASLGANTFNGLQTINSGGLYVNGGGTTFGAPQGVVFEYGLRQTRVSSNIDNAGGLIVDRGTTLGSASGAPLTVRGGPLNLLNNSIFNVYTGTTSGFAGNCPLNVYASGNIGLYSSNPSGGIGLGTYAELLLNAGTGNADGSVTVNGSDLVLGTKSANGEDYTPVALEFTGTSFPIRYTTLTANPSGSDKTITLPNESGTVALETKSNARGWFM
jgi:hypothetical protein